MHVLCSMCETTTVMLFSHAIQQNYLIHHAKWILSELNCCSKYLLQLIFTYLNADANVFCPNRVCDDTTN